MIFFLFLQIIILESILWFWSPALTFLLPETGFLRVVLNVAWNDFSFLHDLCAFSAFFYFYFFVHLAAYTVTLQYYMMISWQAVRGHATVLFNK
jgi:hypothetical protein